MQTIPLSQLQELFTELRQQTNGAIDTDQPWSYFFSAPTAEALEKLSDSLASYHFDGDDIGKDDEAEQFFLELTRLETHTPETLFALNVELETAAAKFEDVVYEGMDIQDTSDEGCCGGDDCHCGDDASEGAHECGCGHDKEEAHECCGGHDKKEDHECCGGHGGEGCCGGHKHYQSADEPIENPAILAAIQTIATDRSEAAQNTLTLALQRGLYLIPTFTGRLDTEPTDDEAVQVLVCTDETDAEYLPLFTDEAALKAWTQEAVSAMVLTAPEAWNFILSQPECAGGVVNPGSSALPLDRKMVTVLQKMIAGE